MEFYFSDANLSRDRFLGNLVKQDPYVDIQVFLQFNKIRALTLEASRIAKALKYSTLLEVSEDGTKVHRIKPIGVKENTEECTIYVQRLPRDADHDSLSSLFSKYGPISYISIPKYRNTRNVKGFAFIEFDKAEDAQKCLMEFREKGYELPSETSPNHVLSITTYDVENKEEIIENAEIKIEKNIEDEKFETEHEDVNEKKELNDEIESKEKITKKSRKRSGTELNLISEDIEKKKSKKRKKESGIESDIEIKKKSEKNKDIFIQESNENNTEKSETLKRTKRKRKITAKTEDEYDQNQKILTDSEVVEKKSTEKEKDKSTSNKLSEENKEKKDVKRKLSIVDEQITSAKKILIEQSKNEEQPVKEDTEENEENTQLSIGSVSSEENEDGEKNKPHEEVLKPRDKFSKKLKKKEKKKLKKKEADENQKEDETVKEKKKKNRIKNFRMSGKLDVTDMGFQVMAKKDWKKLRNRYLELQKSKMHQLKQHLFKTRRNQRNYPEISKMEKEEIDESKQNQKTDKIRDFSFTPGLIVKVDMSQPCVDVQTFKKEFRGNSSVKYVDISEGDTTAYIRLDAVENAKEMVQKATPERLMSVITDDEEKWYWEKMKTDRSEKMLKRVKTNQRGRNKLMKKAEKELGKHIKFDQV